MNLKEEILKNSGMSLEEGIVNKAINKIFKNTNIPEDTKQRKVMEMIIKYIGKNPSKKEMIEKYLNKRRYGSGTHQDGIRAMKNCKTFNEKDFQSVNKSISELKDILNKLF